ncbi:hypothetical protein Bca4012_020201 [Brassica carinata]
MDGLKRMMKRPMEDVYGKDAVEGFNKGKKETEEHYMVLLRLVNDTGNLSVKGMWLPAKQMLLLPKLTRLMILSRLKTDFSVTKFSFSSRPFKLFNDLRTVLADAVIISTGAVAKWLSFAGSGKGVVGFWNQGISACVVCDGAAPIFRNKPLVVIGGRNSAMKKANFLTKNGSNVYIIHMRDMFRASKIMQQRALSNPKIEVIWNSLVVEAYGDENWKGLLGGLKASVVGLFAAGDVQDKKYRQARTVKGYLISFSHSLVD